MLQLADVQQSRDVLNAFAYFPDTWGAKYRHTPVMAMQIPDGADAIKVCASVIVQSKDPSSHEFLYDERTGKPSGCFCNAQVRASETPPDVVDAPNPPGILVSTYSGENVGNQFIIRPYWQLYRWGWILGDDLARMKWATLYVAPASAAIKHPQHLWIAPSDPYALMTLEVYRRGP